MISVILSILKLILIILTLILLLFIILLLLILLVPIRYKVTVKSDDNIRMNGRISWLLRILNFHISYIEDDIKFKFMVFGISIFGSDKEKTKEKPSKKKPPRINDIKKYKTKEKEVSTKKVILKDTDPIIKKRETKKSIIKNKLIKILNKLKSFFNLLKSILLKIYNFLLGIKSDKNSKNKVSKIISFLKNNKLGIKAIKNAIKKLLKHIKPKKFNGDIEFGTGDPSQTGQILGAISIFYGKYGKHIKLTPVFENKTLNGNVFLKGRIRLLTVAIIVLGLVFNEEFKSFLNNFNELKEEL